MKQSWVETGYFQDFLCKADRCRHTCCSEWKIRVNKEEYYRLVTDKYSGELDRALSDALRQDGEEWHIGFNWEGFCPILKNGLCLLYIEKGEAALPQICRLYPRSYKRMNDLYLAGCSTSCEWVCEYLCDHELSLQERPAERDVQLTFLLTQAEAAKVNKLMTAVLSSDKDIRKWLKEICLIYDAGFVIGETDPLQEIQALLAYCKGHDSQLDEYLEIVSYEHFSAYVKAETAFQERFKDISVYMERLIGNSLLYEGFMYAEDMNKERAWQGLCGVYGLLKVLLVANGTDKDELSAVSAAVFRLAEHSSFYRDLSHLQRNLSVLLKL